MLQGRGALQDIDQVALFKPHVKWTQAVKRLRDLAPAIQKAFEVAQTGVPGPVFVECPVDLLYDEAVIREWYAAAAPKGSGVSNRVVRAYLNQHVRRLFAGSVGANVTTREVAAPAPTSQTIERTTLKIANAKRPLLIVGSQALVDARQADVTAQAIERIGIPVYLSGMARAAKLYARPTWSYLRACRQTSGSTMGAMCEEVHAWYLRTAAVSISIATVVLTSEQIAMQDCFCVSCPAHSQPITVDPGTNGRKHYWPGITNARRR
jgi:thiamine pyrophosphate-dependent acetolactate synthase large subunit-like protein